MATASSELIDEVTKLAAEISTLQIGSNRYELIKCTLALRSGVLVDRLRGAEEELAEVRTALDLPTGDICEAIEELQRTAAARRGS